MLGYPYELRAGESDNGERLARISLAASPCLVGSERPKRLRPHETSRVQPHQYSIAFKTEWSADRNHPTGQSRRSYRSRKAGRNCDRRPATGAWSNPVGISRRLCASLGFAYPLFVNADPDAVGYYEKMGWETYIMARHIAKNIVAAGLAEECLVSLNAPPPCAVGLLQEHPLESWRCRSC